MHTQYFDILSAEEITICKDIINNSSWYYGWKSNPITNHKFWNLPKLENNSFFSSDFLKKIEKLTNNKFYIHRIYANGHTFGQEGDWHTDSPEKDDWTFLYYFNEGDPTIIGETYFKDKDDNITDIAKPIYNSGILFKSDITHRGSSPKITFTDLRITIAFKLKLIKQKSAKTLF
jgi:hypothetical protein